MKYLFTFLAIFLFTSPLFSQCADTVNIFSFQYNGKTYEVIKEQKTWTEAAACAVERGGYLVEINDKTEQDSVYDEIINGASIATDYVTINNGGAVAYVWIGATDKKTEGVWLWDGNNDDTGTQFWSGKGSAGSAVNGAYNNWGGTSQGTTNEPDNYGTGQNHGAIGLADWPSAFSWNLGTAGEWNDIIGTSTLYYVIEYDSTSTNANSLKDNSYKIYPNPARDYIIIESGKIENIRGQICSINGQTLLQFESVGKTKLPIRDIPAGIYLIKIKTNQKSFVRKIVISK